jgi:hypothetical protein
MYRIIILLLVCTNSIIAQNKNLKDLLFWEYKIFENPQQKDSVLLYQINKINIYIANKKYNQDLINEFKGINWMEIKDTITQYKYLQNLAIVYFLNNEPDYAYYYFNQYINFSKDTSLKSLIHLTIFSAQQDSSIFYQNLNKLKISDTTEMKKFEDLYLIHHQKYNYKQKYLIASYILPGLGTALLGDVFNGIGSLTFNSLSIYATYLLSIQHLYINAVGWGILLIPRFYGGNIELTQKTINNHFKKKLNTMNLTNEKFLKEVFNKYPVEIEVIQLKN